MFVIGDKVKVKNSGAIGIVQELLNDNEVCVEFDSCAGTQTHYRNEDLDLIRPGNDVTANLELIQSNKDL